VLAASPARAAGRSSASSRTLAPDPATGPPYWLPVTSMHTPRAGFAAVEGRDGRIYAIGGGDSRGGGLASVEVYTPLANTWQAVAPLIAQGYESLAAASGPDGRIYAIAGQNGSEPLTSMEAYLPERNRWISVPSAPSQYVFGSAVRGPDGRIYLVGGGAYDTSRRRWTPVSAIPTTRDKFGAAIGLDGRIYVVGGYVDYTGTLAAVEAYNVSTGRWVTLRSLPEPRQDLGVAAGPDGRIYALGGATASGSVHFRNPSMSVVDAYDPHSDEWQAVAPLRTPRTALAAVQGADGRIYALGGVGPHGSGSAASDEVGLATVEAYGPLIHVLPSDVALGSSAVLTGTNFAASATVTVTWGSTPGGRPVATGRTNRAGALLHPLRFHVPAGVAPGRYVVRAMDDRSRYPVIAPLAVGVPASFGLPPTPLPLPTATATAVPSPTPSPQTRYVAPLGHDAPDCTRVAAPCRTIGYAVGQAVAGDTIQIAAGLYRERVTLTTGLRLVGAGAGATVLDGGGRGAVLTTAPAWPVTLSGVTLRNGSDRGAATFGGGIANNGGILTVTASLITANHAFNGGGIFNGDGTLTVIDSTISANSAVSFGGGIVNLLGRVTVRDSTIRDNSTEGDGGGIATSTGVGVSVLASTISGNSARQGGGIANLMPSTLAVAASTISANHASVAGGGIANTNPQGPQTVTGTILAGNTAGVAASDCAGTLTSGGYNLLGTSGGCAWRRSGHATDRIGTPAAPLDPLLGPLQDNGGPTATQAVQPGSPALDAIPVGSRACPGGRCRPARRGSALPGGRRLRHRGLRVCALTLPAPRLQA